MKVRLLAAVLSLALAPLARAQHFTHNPETAEGPQLWGKVFFPWATCGANENPLDPLQFTPVGLKQSPIDIAGAVDQPLPALTFHYLAAPFVVVNNGHAIQVNMPAGSDVKLGQDGYALLQFHMHAPSEHTVNGALADLELHFVHKNAGGDLAVVGVLFTTKLPPNPLIEKIILAAPPFGPGTIAGQTIDPNQLLPMARTYWTYSGSLTTPPCSEGVRWTVIDQAVGISQAALTRMHQLVAAFPLYEGWPDNNRPVQGLNDRKIFHKK